MKIKNGVLELTKKEQRKERAQRRKERREKEYSYFIGAIGTPHIKIGKTTKPMKYRLAALQTACPHKLIVLAITTVGEEELHKKFHRHRSHCGEWFEWSPEISQFITDWTSIDRNNFNRFCLAIPRAENAALLATLPIPDRKPTTFLAAPPPISPKRNLADCPLDVFRAAWRRKFPS